MYTSEWDTLGPANPNPKVTFELSAKLSTCHVGGGGISYTYQQHANISYVEVVGITAKHYTYVPLSHLILSAHL